MRKDMAKVITERPRRGSSIPSKKTRLRIHRYDPENEYEALPKRIPATRHLDWCDSEVKGFRDLLSPLRRFLRKNVGRPWNKVYSEIMQQLDVRKTMDRHLIEHVKLEVELNCFIGKDGEVYQPCYGPVEGLYVHPKTRLLSWQ
jgi:hypothetical protein